jgi:hypothetical protein
LYDVGCIDSTAYLTSFVRLFRPRESREVGVLDTLFLALVDGAVVAALELEGVVGDIRCVTSGSEFHIFVSVISSSVSN